MIRKILISAYFHSSENIPKNENVNNDDKTIKDDRKSSLEGHRSLKVGQEPHLTKPDHERSLHVPSPILPNRNKIHSLQK